MPKKTTTTSRDVSGWLASATATGVLSPGASSLLTGHLGDVVIAGAAGLDSEDLTTSDVTLVTLLVDASSSIATRGLETSVRDGVAALLDTLAQSREADSILVALWTFAQQHTPVHAYVPVAQATRLDATTYRAYGNTALYDAWVAALTANVAYAQRLRDGGTPTRSVVVVLTDGEDTGSRGTAADCARIAKDLLSSEQFVLAFVGVGSESDFRAVAKSMGIPDGCVAVQENATPAGLRQAFHLVSQSAIRASQGLVSAGSGAGFFAP